MAAQCDVPLQVLLVFLVFIFMGNEVEDELFLSLMSWGINPQRAGIKVLFPLSIWNLPKKFSIFHRYLLTR